LKLARRTLCALILVCCTGQTTLANSSVSNPEITYIARDFAFSGPDEIASGWVTAKLVNQGEDLHQIQFLKLPTGKTAQEFAAEITANHKRLPPWIQRRGGPNSVIPGEESSATVHLEPGEYVVICGIPDRRGVPHVALGMLKTLRVLPTSSKESKAPQADITITEADFTFQLSAPIRPGRTTVRVVNKGTQAHEVVVVRLAPRATVATFLDEFQPGIAATPSGKPVGGMVGLEPEGEGFFTIDFVAGRYGLICFLPDLLRGEPHFMRGMLMDLRVE
jgi:plastocyanin